MRTDPTTLAHLRPSPGKRDWLATTKERIFGDFREGLATTRYHLDRVELIESEITTIAKAHESQLFARGNIGLGLHSRPLVAEYQAFEMALRRSLEYLAAAIAAYFKTDGNRIRGLSDTVADREPRAASTAVCDRLDNADIEGLIGSRSGSKSVRDRLAHHEYWPLPNRASSPESGPRFSSKPAQLEIFLPDRVPFAHVGGDHAR